ncbi:hypothetical protein [Tsuneonella troitsensis]|uniref:hypothetical protein n=1 Tax=Tsuneonella troitsensis TaxID=292222 RepID=UPI00070ED8DF|nr:hypothetical protein [Tsuneonella troitsensis]OGS49721.1 MAG: hypothetical protein A3J40_01155 [Erythrobacter sp. RIFCSPHIGHO2_12_FULL_63_10]
MRIKLLAGGMLMAIATPALAEDWDFVLVNKTGKTIKLVEVSQAGAADWKKDKRDEDFGAKTIKPGDDYTVHFDKDPKVCRYDVRLTFEGDETPIVWTGFDACKFAFGDFALNGGTPTLKGT